MQFLLYTSLVSAKNILDNVYDKEQINCWLYDFNNGVDEYGKESIEEFRAYFYTGSTTSSQADDE